MATVFHKLIEVQIVDGKFKITTWQWSLEDSDPWGLSSYLILHSAGAGLRIQLGGIGINYQFIWRPFFTKKKWIKSSSLNYNIITIETKEQNLQEGDKGSYWKNKILIQNRTCLIKDWKKKKCTTTPTSSYILYQIIIIKHMPKV